MPFEPDSTVAPQVDPVVLCVRCAEITADLATSTGISFKNVVGRVSGTALTRDQMARDLIGCGPVTLTLTLTLTHDDQQGGRPVGGTNPNP
jgi:hypothetical protein